MGAKRSAPPLNRSVTNFIFLQDYTDRVSKKSAVFQPAKDATLERGRAPLCPPSQPANSPNLQNFLDLPITVGPINWHAVTTFQSATLVSLQFQRVE